MHVVPTLIFWIGNFVLVESYRQLAFSNPGFIEASRADVMVRCDSFARLVATSPVAHSLTHSLIACYDRKVDHRGHWKWKAADRPVSHVFVEETRALEALS
mgnify:CR=1 FL=1